MNCVLCGQSNNHPVIENIKNPRTVGKELYNYLTCKNCDLWMLDPYPTQAELNQIYTEAYQLYENEDTTLATRIMNKLSRPREEIVTQHLKPNAKVLDVGCGNGTFLQSLQTQGYNVFGTEWSASAAKSAQSKVGSERITVGDITTASQHQPYDLITLWHVLEHNLDPKALITQIVELLAPQGILVIEVPNSKSALLEKAKNNYPWFSIPEHVTYWSKQSLNTLCSKFQLTNLSSETPFAMPMLYRKVDTNPLSLITSPIVQYMNSKQAKGDILREVWQKSP